MIKLISIKPSNASGKKYTAKFRINDKNKTVHFGATGYSDYTKHHDEERKKRYLARHKKEDWTDPTKAGTLARYILWNKKTITASIADYKRRFKL